MTTNKPTHLRGRLTIRCRCGADFAGLASSLFRLDEIERTAARAGWRLGPVAAKRVAPDYWHASASGVCPMCVSDEKRGAA